MAARFLVVVCEGTTCSQLGAVDGAEQARAALAARGLGDSCTVTRETCLGQCQRGPNVLVCPSDEEHIGALAAQPPTLADGTLYTGVVGGAVARLVERLANGGPGLMARLAPQRKS